MSRVFRSVATSGLYVNLDTDGTGYLRARLKPRFDGILIISCAHIVYLGLRTVFAFSDPWRGS